MADKTNSTRKETPMTISNEELSTLGEVLLDANEQSQLRLLLGKGEFVDARRLLADKVDGLYEAGRLTDEIAEEHYLKLGLFFRSSPATCH